MTGAGARPSLSRVTAFDDVVSPRVIRELRRQALAAPPTPRMIWYRLGTAPRTLFEQVIERLRSMMPNAQRLVGAEWWSRSPASDLGLPFHFDRDEAIRDELVCPALSSVLYLTEVGGPTVIMSTTPASRSLPSAGIAVHTRPGRCVVFPGMLLHAVLPGPKSRWPRISVPINWWTFEPRHPAREVPRDLLRASPLASPRALRSVPMRPRERLQRFAPRALMNEHAWRIAVDNAHPSATGLRERTRA